MLFFRLDFTEVDAEGGLFGSSRKRLERDGEDSAGVESSGIAGTTKLVISSMS